MEKQVTYGLYDLQDKCWMANGDTDGKPNPPNTYTDPELARAAAAVCCRMFKFRTGRIMARPFKGKNLKLKDSVDSVMTCQEAIDSLEKEGK